MLALIQLQGYLAHKKRPPHRALQQAYAEGPVAVLGGGSVPYERGTPVIQLLDPFTPPYLSVVTDSVTKGFQFLSEINV